MDDYRVNLDIYNGPLDLLLYLIRRDEVDIHDIPIARITEQYVGYVEMLQQFDPNLAGEFLVLAATLIEIKTRMLLPSAPPEEGGEDGLDAIDPRAELVRQLLQYKAFKDAAGELAEAAETWSLRMPRKPALPEELTSNDVDLEEVQIWNLLDAFSRVMKAIGAGTVKHEVIYDDTPVELHETDILNRLEAEGPLTFRRIFEGRTRRSEMLGLFLALLELIRQKRIAALQDHNFGDIHIQLRTERPKDISDDEPVTAATETSEDTVGQYVPDTSDVTDTPDYGETDHEHRTEDSGSEA